MFSYGFVASNWICASQILLSLWNFIFTLWYYGARKLYPQSTRAIGRFWLESDLKRQDKYLTIASAGISLGRRILFYFRLVHELIGPGLNDKELKKTLGEEAWFVFPSQVKLKPNGKLWSVIEKVCSIRLVTGIFFLGPLLFLISFKQDLCTHNCTKVDTETKKKAENAKTSIFS